MAKQGLRLRAVGLVEKQLAENRCVDDQQWSALMTCNEVSGPVAADRGKNIDTVLDAGISAGCVVDGRQRLALSFLQQRSSNSLFNELRPLRFWNHRFQFLLHRRREREGCAFFQISQEAILCV